MPEAATAEEIETVYLEGWKLGLKAIAVYRDNSKRSQPLSTGKKKDEGSAEQQAVIAALQEQLAVSQVEAGKPHRRRLPAERTAVTHKFDIAGHEGYITVGLYPDGQPGEIFLKMAKEGSTVSGLMDSFATTVSVALQYGVPLRDLVNKFAHVRFEPSGFTGNQEIPIAKSIVDYIFRWLGSRFLGSDDKATLGLVDRSASGSEYPGFGLSAASSSENNGPLADARDQAFSAAEPPTADPGSSTSDKTTEPRASVAIGAPSGGKGASALGAGASAVAADTPSVGAGSGELTVIAKAGNGHAAPAKSNGSGTVTLSLGSTNVAFKIQEDAPSCAECGSIMVRNGSCYKCLNCGSTSGCS
jgi:ribonucleoside-diphosphate reductase alpha chain